MNPDKSAEDIIEKISTALSKLRKDTNIIIAGDLNCRIDKPNQKTEIVIETLMEEGYSLINQKDEKTYFGHNGPSTIDMVGSGHQAPPSSGNMYH